MYFNFQVSQPQADLFLCLNSQPYFLPLLKHQGACPSAVGKETCRCKNTEEAKLPEFCNSLGIFWRSLKYIKVTYWKVLIPSLPSSPLGFLHWTCTLCRKLISGPCEQSGAPLWSMCEDDCAFGQCMGSRCFLRELMASQAHHNLATICLSRCISHPPPCILYSAAWNDSSKPIMPFHACSSPCICYFHSPAYLAYTLSSMSVLLNAQ